MQLTISTKKITNSLFFVLLSILLFLSGFYFNQYFYNSESDTQLINPFVSSKIENQKPLLEYSIPQLQKKTYNTSQLKLEKVLSEEPTYTSFLFTYTTLGKTMSGQINIPDKVTANPLQNNQVIILLRGYVSKEIYTTGTGTKNAADAFAAAGYITIAPDFFGFGESSPEPEDPWQARFEKPITVIELIKTIEEKGVPIDTEKQQTINTISDIGIWAHSNGGQIALTTLEILNKSIPTTLWAPVTAPFPYSVLYFSDELEDEGKAQRKWISLFEDEYDVFDFSLTQHLNSLNGPIQIQHGTADDAALIFWSREFIDKVTVENTRRAQLLEISRTDTATQSASKNLEKKLEPIEIELIEHQNANHNMQPSWNIAIQNDLRFFDKHLK